MRIALVMLLLFSNCSTSKLAKMRQIAVLDFAEFVENPEKFSRLYIGVKGYYVEGLPQLYKDKGFYESISHGGEYDSIKFEYLHIIEIPKYHRTKRPPSLPYLEGTYVIAYGRPTRIKMADSPIRYGGYLLVDSIVRQNIPKLK